MVTPDHACALRARLQADGFDVDDLERWGQLRILDASSVLDVFLVDGMPSPHTFRALCASLVEEARLGSRNGRIRVYGEMVNILCHRGQVSRPEGEQPLRAAHAGSIRASSRRAPAPDTRALARSPPRAPPPP